MTREGRLQRRFGGVGTSAMIVLMTLLVLTGCGQAEEASNADTEATTVQPAAATRTASPSPTSAPESPTSNPATVTASSASPTSTRVSATPSPEPSRPADATPSPSPSPPIPFVETAQLDNPDLGVTVYWPGERFDPSGDLPMLTLSWVFGPAPPANSRGTLEYTADGSGVVLRLMRRDDWEAAIAAGPESSDDARILHMFWDSPCAERQELEIDGGQAVVYGSYQVLADPAVTDCPASEPDRFLAHAFLGDTVVLVNAPHFFEPPDMPSFSGPYNSFDGLVTVVEGLQPRQPVVDPTPPPTPAASIDDPRSLVLQHADLPGRYGYGDDGCSPRYDCPIGPHRFGAEGTTEELRRAFGEFLAFSYQYEHVGFDRDGGTPEPTVEPPAIDSHAFVCVSDCDPAAILEVGIDLLDDEGHQPAREVDQVSGLSGLGDEARLYEVEALALGQFTQGYAVLWRHGPVVGLVVVAGSGEQGREIAIELARTQQERIATATG